MSRKRRFVNRNSGKKFEEIFTSFVVVKTAKGVSDITIRNYHQNIHNISLHFDISMPFDDLTKEHALMDDIHRPITLVGDQPFPFKWGCASGYMENHIFIKRMEGACCGCAYLCPRV